MTKRIRPVDPAKIGNEWGGGLWGTIGRFARSMRRKMGARLYSDSGLKDHVAPVVW